MKRILFFGWILIIVVVPSMGIAQTTAPTISDLQVSGFENLKPGEPTVTTYKFKSDQLPDNVSVETYYASGMSSRRTVYSSKKNELQVITEEKEGIHEVMARREGLAPPSVAGGKTVDVEVWTTSGGKTSNKLKGKIPIP